MTSRLLELLNSCDAVVQVALDVTSLWDALRVASILPGDTQLMLEVGTPLLKASGVNSIKALKSIKPHAPIVVDTKTFDAADVEASIVSEAGGDAFTVLALSSEETISTAISKARELGLVVYVDTMNVSNLEVTLERLSTLGARVALIHVGLDVQRRLGVRAVDLAGYIRRASEIFKGFIAVAGGIRPGEASLMAGMGAKVIVIGSAIVKSPDPRVEALRALESLRGAGFKCR